MSCWPSSRLIVVVSGVNAPALTFAELECNDGAKGRLAPGHGAWFGPEVIWKVELALAGGVPDHGVNDALVV